jgi:hypothetical protein
VHDLNNRKRSFKLIYRRETTKLTFEIEQLIENKTFKTRKWRFFRKREKEVWVVCKDHYKSEIDFVFLQTSILLLLEILKPTVNYSSERTIALQGVFQVYVHLHIYLSQADLNRANKVDV